MKFSSIAAVITDMDGVLWRGDEPLPGIVELFDWFRESATPFALATNNSSKTPADYAAKLARMGVHNIPESSIVTSATATAAYMQTQYPAGTRLHVVGMSSLRNALEDAGFELYDDTAEPVQVVVSGVDFELTYDKLRRATFHIRAGADFVGTNPDKTFPTPEGLTPGAGSILAALATATDRQPLIIGKPGRPMFDAALALLRTPAEQTLMIGDRLDTDIDGARQVGLLTALVFTGITQPDDLTQGDSWPDAAYEDLPALLKAWAGDDWYRERVKARRR